MTPFELQVAEALTARFIRGNESRFSAETYAELASGRRRPPLIDEFAPYIAEAIKAGIVESAIQAGQKTMGWDVKSMDAALKALRGE